MYRLSPCPVTGHHIAVLSLFITEFLICDVVDMAIEVWISEDAPDHVAGVPEPKVVLHSLPFWRANRFGGGPNVSEGGMLPRDAAKVNCIYLVVEISVVGDGWGVAVGNERRSPEFE